MDGGGQRVRGGAVWLNNRWATVRRKAAVVVHQVEVSHRPPEGVVRAPILHRVATGLPRPICGRLHGEARPRICADVVESKWPLLTWYTCPPTCVPAMNQADPHVHYRKRLPLCRQITMGPVPFPSPIGALTGNWELPIDEATVFVLLFDERDLDRG